MELETVLYRVEGNVGIVSLNRTKAMNALISTMLPASS